MYKLLFIISSFLMTQLNSCEKTDIALKDNLEGEWVLKNVFLSDAIDSPCGWEAGEHSPLTLNINLKDDKYAISGNSAVNSYFGSFELLSYDSENNTGKIESGAIGSTKKAGPEALMNCESRFLGQLERATDFAFDDNDKLRIGNFRDENSHPRDGGYYLIFEKK